MAFNLHVVRTSDFLRLDAHGRPDLAESRRVLAKVAKECVDRGIDSALLNVRDLHGHLSLTDIYQLVRTFQEMGFQAHHRLAVLHRYNDEQRGEFFAMFASARGWNVRAFYEAEDAIEWFSRPEKVEGGSQPET